MDVKKIFEILNIKESFQIRGELLKRINNNTIDEIIQKFKENDTGEVDILRDAFQNTQGDRATLKQDYTPDCICKLVRRLALKNDVSTVADVCSGTGALSASLGKDKAYMFQEASENVFPFLLFNTMYRNLNATIKRHDVLKDQTIEEWRTVATDKGWATIEKVKPTENVEKFDCIVSNPPYSLKYDASIHRMEERYMYGMTPPNYSDYLFVQDALHHLKDDGYLYEILPHGVLFRGKK